MRVAFDTGDLYPDWGGVYTYSSQLLLHLMRLAEPPSVILLDGQGARRKARRKQEVMDVLDASLRTIPYISARWQPLMPTISGPRQLRHLTRAVARETNLQVVRPLWQHVRTVPWVARRLVPGPTVRDLDLCHWSDTTLLRLPGVAHVVTMHDTIPIHFPSWQSRDHTTYAARQFRLAARYATRLIADSQCTKQDAMNQLGVPEHRIDVIPLAPPPDLRPPTDLTVQQRVLERYGLGGGDYVLHVGSFSPRKNLVRLAGAFRAAIQQTPELTTRLVLAGYGSHDQQLDRSLEKLNLGRRLLKVGSIPPEDLPALLHGARVVAYVSLYEGFGLPPLEAMACGTPVIASNNSSIPEVVGDAGLLVDPYSTEQIAMALHRVMTDDLLRAELAARGTRRAAQFTWTRTAEMTMQTYRRAIETQRQQAR